MIRDIDQIIDAVKHQVPDVEVWQLQPSHPADDDGIWWFYFRDIKDDIQLESSYGNCPFIVETNELCCDKARRAETIADAVTMIVEYLNMLKKTS